MQCFIVFPEAVLAGDFKQRGITGFSGFQFAVAVAVGTGVGGIGGYVVDAPARL
jgi:hypothetical protein